MGNTILVTGGAGFIGSHIVERLLSHGNDVVVVDDLSTGKSGNVPEGVTFLKRDIQDDLSDVFARGIDYIFHAAAQMNVRKSLEDPKADAMINLIGGLNLLDHAVRGNVKKIIFSSTGGAMYSPEASVPCDEESLAESPSPYGLMKRTFERYLDIYEEIHGLSSVSLRYGNVYGPRQNAKGEAGVVSIFIDNALRGRRSTINGDGENTRDYIYVEDVVEANLHVLHQDLTGIYNVGTSIETSVNNVFGSVAEHIEGIEPAQNGPEIVGELRRNALSIEKLRATGWLPQVTFTEGLKRTVEYFKKNS